MNVSQIKNIKEVTEPLKGDVHTIEEMKAWLKPFGYSDAINDAAIIFILREFVINKFFCDDMRLNKKYNGFWQRYDRTDRKRPTSAIILLTSYIITVFHF